MLGLARHGLISYAHGKTSINFPRVNNAVCPRLHPPNVSFNNVDMNEIQVAGRCLQRFAVLPEVNTFTVEGVSLPISISFSNSNARTISVLTVTQSSQHQVCFAVSDETCRELSIFIHVDDQEIYTTKTNLMSTPDAAFSLLQSSENDVSKWFNVLTDHEKNPEIAMRAFQWLLIRFNFGQCGAILTAVTNTAKLHITNVDLQIKALAALSWCISKEVNHFPIQNYAQQEVVFYIHEVMNAHPLSFGVQWYACSTVARLAEDNEARKILLSSGMIDVCRHATKAYVMMQRAIQALGAREPIGGSSECI